MAVVKCELLHSPFLLHTTTAFHPTRDPSLSTPSQHTAERVVYHIVHFGDATTSDVLESCTSHLFLSIPIPAVFHWLVLIAHGFDEFLLQLLNRGIWEHLRIAFFYILKLLYKLFYMYAKIKLSQLASK